MIKCNVNVKSLAAIKWHLSVKLMNEPCHRKNGVRMMMHGILLYPPAVYSNTKNGYPLAVLKVSSSHTAQRKKTYIQIYLACINLSSNSQHILPFSLSQKCYISILHCIAIFLIQEV